MGVLADLIYLLVLRARRRAERARQAELTAFTSDLPGPAHVFNADAIIDLLSLVPGAQRGVTA
ncbi:hypothetical protein [Lentzea sp. NPDC092896]|uniref:hypothetical protein n=1 Tax=Lentzea sp. NPDC092896 TaxID=3364127 RepID=UPI0038224B62